MLQGGDPLAVQPSGLFYSQGSSHYEDMNQHIFELKQSNSADLLQRNQSSDYVSIG